MILHRRDLNLTLLETFRVFAEGKTLAATAQKLGRSQPAISNRLAQLERELNANLFERAGRRLILTPLGRALRAELEALQPGLQRLVDLLQDATACTGRLLVGALPTAAVFYLVPRLPRLQTQFPNLRLDLTYGLVDELMQQLRNADLDLVLGIGEPNSQETAAMIELAQVRPVRVFSRQAPETTRWIAYGETSDRFFTQVWSYMSRRNITNKVVTRVSHIQTIKAMVAEGLGQAILPDYTVTEDNLGVAPLKDLDLVLPLWCALRRLPFKGSMLDTLIQILKNEPVHGASHSSSKD